MTAYAPTYSAYTPTISQGVTLPKVVQYAAYLRPGGNWTAALCSIVVQIDDRRVPAFAGHDMWVTKPHPHPPSFRQVGIGYIHDASADCYYPATVWDASTDAWMLELTSAVTLAPGDTIAIQTGPPIHTRNTEETSTP